MEQKIPFCNNFPVLNGGVGIFQGKFLLALFFPVLSLLSPSVYLCIFLILSTFYKLTSSALTAIGEHIPLLLLNE